MLSTFFRKSFLLSDLHRSKFANIVMIQCKTTCRNYLCLNPFILVITLKNLIFSLFPVVKINANYAEICSVGDLEADFRQIPLIHFFLKVSQYCCETPIIQIQQRKLKIVS